MKSSTILQIVLPPSLLAVAVAVAWVFVVSKPKAPQHPPQRQLPLVETAVITPATRRLDIVCRGEVEARTESLLSAEVGGRIAWVSQRLLSGALVEHGEELLRIDDADYRAALANAEALLANRRRMLAEEEARAVRQIKEWQAVGQGEAPELLRREPHLAAAKADVGAAVAAVDKARRDLERCRVRAPYAARVVAKHVDLGQQLSPGARIADLQAADAVELRLPLSLAEVLQLGLPLDGAPVVDGPVVDLRSLARGDLRRWQGRVERCAARLDARNRLLDVMVLVPQTEGVEPLLVGQFVEATIAGRAYDGVAELPAAALHGDDQIWLCRSLSDEERQAYAPPAAEEEPEPGLLMRLRIAMTGVGEKEGQKRKAAPLPDAALQSLRVHLLRRLEDTVLVEADWPTDCPPVMTSRVIGASDGMPLRLATSQATAEPASDAEEAAP